MILDVTESYVFTLEHRKASNYTASSNKGLADACFLVGSKTIWDTRIYVVKTLSCMFFRLFALTLLNNSSCTNCELIKFFLVSRKCISRPYCIMRLFCANITIFLKVFKRFFCSWKPKKKTPSKVIINWLQFF